MTKESNNPQTIDEVEYETVTARRRPTFVTVKRLLGSKPVTIVTPSGEVTAMPGDYIATDSSGAEYPIIPEVFDETYDVLLDKDNRDVELDRYEAPGILITWQTGAVKEAGKNGAQVREVLIAAKERIEHLNQGHFTDPHNEKILEGINLALEWDEKRTTERTLRGVEGTTVP